MEPEMDVDTGILQVGERSLDVEGEKCEEQSSFEADIEVDIATDEADICFMEAGDLYHLNFTVAVTETETEEIDNEFMDALTEIKGEKSFPCSKCDKICKSKGGLTKHTNSKHRNIAQDQSEMATPLCEDTLSSIVESIKRNIIEQNLYGTALNSSLSSASSSPKLFMALLPLYETFSRKKNQDQLLQSFYGLMPQSCELLSCEDFKAANLIMIHIPDHLVGFYNTSQTRDAQKEGTTSTPVEQLDPAERGPLSYVCGYVIFKLFQMNKRKTGKENEELQALLVSMKCPDQSTSFISSRSRGGLVNPCQDLIGILEQAEYAFRKQVGESKLSLRNIPADNICIVTLESPLVKSLWGNIVMSSGVDPSTSTQKLCLENVVKLYLKVRSFSYARDYVNKYKIKQKQGKKKALRKNMKQCSMIVNRKTNMVRKAGKLQRLPSAMLPWYIT